MAKRSSKERKQVREYTPWIEKYRPEKIDDIAHQSHVVSTLKKSLQSANLPHLLFYGPPGTGKTSTILALARQLYGRNLMKTRVLELNASDERGINVVRKKIKTFASYTVSKEKEAGYPCPPYKIIILDEADSMTRDAQTALRRTMEKYSNVTRFCLICNYVSRIIAPVASRCAKFRFQLLSEGSMSNKLREIAGYENLRINEETIRHLIHVSKGDMRKSITLLQSSSLMKQPHEMITSQDVNAVTVQVPQDIIDNVLMRASCSRSFEQINNAATYVVAEGYPVSLILAQLLETVINSSEFNSMGKAHIAIKIGEADKKVVDGASEFLQLLDVLGCVAQNFPSTTA